jgi:hypothetical protein
MRKALSGLLLGTLLCFSGCAAGPHQLFRTVDDWDAKVYTDSPWLDAVLWVIPVMPLARFGASIGDFFIADAYSFWFQDAWDGKGTGFKHAEYLGTDGHVKSLLLEDGDFLQVSGK